jgi:hypothetical protein
MQEQRQSFRDLTLKAISICLISRHKGDVSIPTMTSPIHDFIGPNTEFCGNFINPFFRCSMCREWRDLIDEVGWIMDNYMLCAFCDKSRNSILEFNTNTNGELYN